MKLLSLLIILFFYGTITMANELKESQDYTNLQKYLSEAQNFATKGDTKKAGQRLKYAEMFMKKLKKKGFESELKKEISLIEKLTLIAMSNKKIIKKSMRSATKWAKSEPKNDLEQYQQENEYINKYDPKGHGLDRLLRWDNNKNEENYNRFLDFNKNDALTVIQKLENAEDTGKEIHNLKNKAKKMQQEIENFDENIKRYAVTKRIDSVIENLKAARSKEEYNNNLNEMLYFIKTILLLSPNNAELIPRLATVKNLGKNQDKIIADNNKPIDNRKFAESLPEAAQKNENLEQQILESLHKVYYAVIDFKSVILSSDEWIETKTPTEHYRSMNAVLTGKHIGKHANLGCFYQYFDLRQRPNGDGGWGKAGRNSSGERFYIDCNKL